MRWGRSGAEQSGWDEFIRRVVAGRPRSIEPIGSGLLGY